MAKRVVHLLELIQVNHQQSHLGFGTASTLQSSLQPFLKEPAVCQSGQIVMQRLVLGVFDLVFQQQQNHSDGDHVFRKIPYLALDMHI